MDLVALLAAAEAGEPHDETAFLVVGGLLALFAIVVGVLGIVRHTTSDGTAKAVMGVGALLVVGTMLTVVVS